MVVNFFHEKIQDRESSDQVEYGMNQADDRVEKFSAHFERPKFAILSPRIPL